MTSSCSLNRAAAAVPPWWRAPWGRQCRCRRQCLFQRRDLSGSLFGARSSRLADVRARLAWMLAASPLFLRSLDVVAAAADNILRWVAPPLAAWRHRRLWAAQPLVAWRQSPWRRRRRTARLGVTTGGHAATCVLGSHPECEISRASKDSSRNGRAAHGTR